nr:uncharacterized protein LOC129417843 isoform X1 [Misgurnus anguillicaudatus]
MNISQIYYLCGLQMQVDVKHETGWIMTCAQFLNKDCSDQDGNIHTFNTEWEDDTQNCVCSTYGTICCPRFGFGVTEFFADDFVTFSANDEEYGSGPGLIPEERLALKWAF